ncbi:helix-turn-helix domain-containing protein [Halosimplex litoreum]|uniref:Helix-turn-helix domain-containing protein n=1 Tax=Halosimplex litoreum TaxID=1198301 RepID=A0A7T3FVM8_9EURY|nr:helix-turn-helix domain-containing protein [Halosimplex litoreum]QPV61491.1 helix-turn-helix domain-containing protein [Halosimplex litoreum]
MKRLRVTAAVDGERAPAFYTMLADAPGIAETQLLEWNATPDPVETVLFAVRGDAEPFAAAAPELDGIESVRLSPAGGPWTYALVEVRPRATAMFAAVREARTRSGLVVRKPIVYRDGDMRFRVVGDGDALGAALAEAPDAMDVTVEAVGAFRGVLDHPASRLSDRQREALAVAQDLGYYERPREATHADVAAALDCAPSTASRHLQAAEAKLVDAAMDEFGPAV